MERSGSSIAYILSMCLPWVESEENYEKPHCGSRLPGLTFEPTIIRTRTRFRDMLTCIEGNAALPNGVSRSHFVSSRSH
jgi:hypothetical protein